MDFRNVTDKFIDPDFDGEAVKIKEIKEDEDIDNTEDDDNSLIIDEESGEEIIFVTPSIKNAGEIDEEPKTPREKIYINGVDVTVLNERIQVRNNSGELITTSYKDYTKQKIQEEFSSLDDFLNKWSKADKKQAIIDELYEKDILFTELKDEIGKDIDVFDLICHIAYDKPPLTRKERVKSVQKRDYFTKYEGTARAIIEKLLQKYSDEGIESIETISVLKLPDFSEFGSPIEIVNIFGGKPKYLELIQEIEYEIYKEAI